ncbi:PilZ domain-containing protein [Brevibacillus fulvus]|uniref:C-di-GMP-binding flagellar brake protein YcgR n=1 Tax=Brevibacillus fulvus TaxID=1125967 RepID=A0A938XY37_9BACL|nr:PilZ domain-containing protein [Brevibacillus fulvus]MBM7589768.1 c-di-GMP-binding flagellar brake protein YcgR [Brevibacillus fulvus]
MESVIHLKIGEKMYQGEVTYEEGDLLEAVFPERLHITIGNSYDCLISRNLDILDSFQAVLLAKKDKRIVLFHSPTIAEFREQRRRYPRFDVNFRGWLKGVQHAAAHGPKSLMIEVINVGMGGFAFRCEQKLSLQQTYHLFTELPGPGKDKEQLQAKVEILHERTTRSLMYGCKIVGISPKNLHILRRYILSRQLQQLDFC